jgi:Fe-Mn family superoxide dismutase
MDDVTRRAAVGAMAVGAMGLVTAANRASAQESSPAITLAPSFAGKHQPKPLRFNPAKLDGLSERLIQSHWENNDGGSVRTLNMIENRLGAAIADPDFRRQPAVG